MNITRVGVDIAKSVFHAYAVDRYDHPVWQAKLTRSNWLAQIVKQVPEGAEIGL